MWLARGMGEGDNIGSGSDGLGYGIYPGIFACINAVVERVNGTDV